MDYTVGAFTNVKPEDFRFRWTAPMVLEVAAHWVQDPAWDPEDL